VVILALTLILLIVAYTMCFGFAGLLRLAHLPLRGGWLAALGCAVQFLGFSMSDYRFVMFVFSTILLLAFCWRNRQYAGMWLVATGIALNMAVMLANGATMPVNPASLREMTNIDLPAYSLIEGSKDQVLPDELASLPWLGDRLLLPGPFASLAVWSIGDVMLIIGVARLLWLVMKGKPDDRTSYGTATATP
jgi:hypothetical protein